MRSLTVKLTLAFLVVGLVGTVLMAILVSGQTQREFDQFIADRYGNELRNELVDYYQTNGSWQGIGTILMRNPYNRPGGREYVVAPVTLTDATGVVVQSGRRERIGQQLSASETSHGIPVEVDGVVVGRIVVDSMNDRGPGPASPEADFLDRVRQAIIVSAGAAAVLALLLGILLARTIARPVRELTTATQVVAQGQLGHRVPVRTQDELGDLARSFNQMSADLERASVLRRQMTADIAHELRTPLSVILGYTEALSESKLPGTPEVFATMYGEAQLLNHLIDDLRTLSLADAGELPLNRQPSAPRALLERTAAAHAARANQKGVELTVEADTHLPLVLVDPERIAQVLGNLVTNALRYTPAGRSIVLAAEPAAEGAGSVLKIQDYGSGIAPEDLPHIFDRFYRGDQARQQDEGESGLGLAIVKSIIEAHGGTIQVASVVDEGTTFTITLPAAEEDVETSGTD